MTSSAEKPILFEQVGEIARITLNRPAKLNAMNQEVFRGFIEYLDRCYDPSIRAVIIRGAGRAFCSGDDISGARPTDESGRPLGGYGTQDPWEYLRRESPYRIVKEIRKHQKPIIAAVHGYCLGMGCEVALASDFRVVADDARFGLVYVRRALIGGTWILAQHVGLSKATEYLLTGDMWDADQAEKMGIVAKRVRREDLDEEALAYAQRLATLPTKVVGYIKSALNRSMHVDAETGLENAIWANGFAARAEDSGEGRRAFQEKREARFTGR